MQITERAKRAWILKGNTAINLSSCFFHIQYDITGELLQRNVNCRHTIEQQVSSTYSLFYLKLDSHYIEAILHGSLSPVTIIPLEFQAFTYLGVPCGYLPFNIYHNVRFHPQHHV